MTAKIVDGNLLECSEKYILHQSNCVSNGAAGLAYDIFKKFPYADIYSPRMETGHHDEPGKIIVRGNGKDERYIIALMGQYFPGNPAIRNHDYRDVDSYKMREWYFFSGLKEVTKIKDLESIAFPYMVGCGLAGGNWEKYIKIINRFAEYVQKNQGADTVIYCRKL